jgi:hypothetical protein
VNIVRAEVTDVKDGDSIDLSPLRVRFKYRDGLVRGTLVNNGHSPTFNVEKGAVWHVDLSEFFSLFVSIHLFTFTAVISFLVVLINSINTLDLLTLHSFRWSQYNQPS